MGRTIAVFALALTLPGCAAAPPLAAAPPPRAGEPEHHDALTTCLSAAAIKLDDGQSEVSTIALSLRPLCAAEFARSRDASAHGLNPTETEMFHRTDDDAFMQMATTAVLNERAKRH
jgi:hypothetical protein